jgi:predicted acetyltransferase
MARADDLWVLAFGSNWVRDFAWKELSTVYGAFEGNELHALTGVIDYKICFGDKEVDCGGIAAVATAPGQRYQNLITMLLEKAVRDLHDRDFPFSSLYPFSHPFYAKMGWASTHWQYRIEVETQWMKKVRGGHPKRFRMLPKEHWEELIPVYERWHKHFNLNLNRPKHKFEKYINYPAHDFQIMIHDDGYMIFDLKNSDRKAGKLIIPEFAYCTEQAFLDGIAMLAQMDSQFERIMYIDAEPDGLLRFGVPQPRPVLYRDTGMMTRVVNQKAFEKLLPKPLKGITLADPLGVTSPQEGDVGVGEVLQIMTGFLNKPDRFPELYRTVADKPAFCIERY